MVANYSMYISWHGGVVGNTLTSARGFWVCTYWMTGAFLCEVYVDMQFRSPGFS